MKGSKYVWKSWKQFTENDVSISNLTLSSGSHTKQFKIKVLEEEFRKTHEKLDKIEQELKRLEEENEEDSEIMPNDLIFTSAGELLNSKKEE